MDSTRVVISIGSNSAEKMLNVGAAIEWLQQHLTGVRASSIYTTAASNGVDDDYANAVVEGYTIASFESLNALFKQYESSCGRTLQSKKQGRIPIDLDIVVWGDVVVRERDSKANYFTIGWKELQK